MAGRLLLPLALAIASCLAMPCPAEEIPPLRPVPGAVILDDLDYPSEQGARAAWTPICGTAPVTCVPLGKRRVLKLPCNFSGTRIERASWDLSIDFDLVACRGVQFRFFSRDVSPVSGFSLYFRSGSGWYAARFSPRAKGGWSTVEIDKSETAIEGTPAGFGKIDAIRVSAWRGGDTDTAFYLADLALLGQDAPIVLIRGASAARSHPGEARTITSCAETVGRVLADLGLTAVLMDDLDVTAERLQGKLVAVLPYDPAMPAEAVEGLREFVAAGGKILAFYTLPEPLSEVAGIEIGRHVREEREGQFAALCACGNVLEGMPDTVRQSSWNIREARAIEGKSEVAAEWLDAAGQSARQAAIVASANCVFMTHVLLVDDPAARRLLVLAMLGHLAPSLRQTALAHALASAGAIAPFTGFEEASAAIRKLAGGEGRALARLEEIEAMLAEARDRAAEGTDVALAISSAEGVSAALIDLFCEVQQPQPGEHRAFWCHDAFGVSGLEWEEAIGILAANGFTAILPNMLWGGVAYYESDVLPVAPEVRERGDQIAACLAACRAHGVECHVWKVNWNMGGRAPREFAERMVREGRTQVRFDGTSEEQWLCPSHPANQQLEIDAMVEVATKYAVDGVHFDYIRYPGPECCFCAGCRGRFEQVIGRRVDGWPSVVQGDDALNAQWLEFRRAQITRVVSAVADAVHERRPGVEVSAAVFPNWPVDRDGVGQDWKAWCELGCLDFVCPMDYTPDPGQFEALVERQRGWAGAVPCYPGIGLSTWPERGDISALIEQIQITRRFQTGGFTVFNYGLAEAREILPRCGAGITRP
ncbi:MAG: family 10 glycosylhydrolase [Planctomycetes bacterium]|nr:family 10 glycosylhydrolase [Planctomycetota bacterium]